MGWRSEDYGHGKPDPRVTGRAKPGSAAIIAASGEAFAGLIRSAMGTPEQREREAVMARAERVIAEATYRPLEPPPDDCTQEERDAYLRAVEAMPIEDFVRHCVEQQKDMEAGRGHYARP